MFRIPKKGPKPNTDTWVLPSGNIILAAGTQLSFSLWLRQSHFENETRLLRKEAGRRVWEEEPSGPPAALRSGSDPIRVSKEAAGPHRCRSPLSPDVLCRASCVPGP